MPYRVTAAILAAVLPATAVAQEWHGPSTPTLDITADGSRDDWGVIIDGDVCNGYMTTGPDGNHVFGLGLRYDPDTYQRRWGGRFEIGEVIWDKHSNVPDWTVSVDLLGRGAAFAYAKFHVPASSRGTPTEFGLTQWFPWDERIRMFDRLDMRIQAPNPGGNSHLVAYAVYRAPDAKNWIDDIEKCAGGVLVDRTYRRYSPAGFQLTLGGRQFLPESATAYNCETVFVMPGGRRLRYQAGGSPVKMTADGTSIELGADGTSLYLAPNLAHPASAAAIKAVFRAHEIQHDACI